MYNFVRCLHSPIWNLFSNANLVFKKIYKQNLLSKINYILFSRKKNFSLICSIRIWSQISMTMLTQVKSHSCKKINHCCSLSTSQSMSFCTSIKVWRLRGVGKPNEKKIVFAPVSSQCSVLPLSWLFWHPCGK